jgi:uncharacterized protein YegP (UPF0339 family)
MAGAARYEVFPSRRLGILKAWRFRLIAGNGEQVGRDSEAYPTEGHAVRGAEDHQQASADAEIVVVDS